MSFLPALIDSSKKRTVAHRRCATSKVEHSSNLFYSPAKSRKQSKDVSNRLEFFDAFRNISRMQQKRNYSRIEDTPQLAYLKSVEQEKLFPMPMFESKTRRISNNFAKSYAEALHLTKLDKLDLQGNDLNVRSLSTILERLDSSELTRLNLSGNQVGGSAMKSIVKFFSNLKHLELEDCALSPQDIGLICETLESNTSLKFLNLAKNRIKDQNANSIGSALRKNFTLKGLDLHWNLMNRVNGFFSGLGENKTLRQLDLSWNCLGANFSEITGSFHTFSEQNKALKHLDISFNSIGKKDCIALAESLLSNHTLLGVHTTGNACKVNPQGFIEICQIQKAHSFERLFAAEKLGENCWICEKWVEGSLTVPETCDPCFVHLEVENFEARMVEKSCVSVAMPSDTQKLFFSNIKGEAFTLTELKEVEHDMCKLVNHQEEVTIHVNKVNILESTGAVCNSKDDFGPEPRRTPAKYTPVIEIYEEVKPPWCFENSIFKKFVLDSPELLDASFNFDWEHSKISRLNFKDETDIANCKDTLQKHYYMIKCCYKILSVGSFAEVFSVSSNTLHEFLTNHKVIDNCYKFSDFGVNWSASLIPKVKGKRYNPSNTLVRHEFLEILVRISTDKYNSMSISAGVSKLLGELKSRLENFDYNSWRKYFFIEEVDQFFTENSEMLALVFSRYSGTKSYQRIKSFLQLEEFKELCSDLGFKSTGRTIDKCFVSAIFPQINELDNSRHMEMTILEFYEGLARVADLKIGDSLVSKLNEIKPKLVSIAQSVKKEKRRSNTVTVQSDLRRRRTTQY